MIRLRDTLNGLASGHKYLVPETGILITASNFPTLLDRVQKHCVANNISIEHVEMKIHEYLCSINSPEMCYDAEHPLPPFSVQAVSLLHAAGSTIKGVLMGHQLREDEPEAQRRMRICEGCEFYRKSDQKCSRCGCSLAAKTALRAEHCPIGRW